MLKELKNCNYILVKTTVVDRFQVKKKMCKTQYYLYMYYKSITTYLELMIFQAQCWIPCPYDNNNL